MIEFFKKALCVCAVVSLLAAATGCPDYSHQRPVPDYENMTDGGEPETEESQDQ